MIILGVFNVSVNVSVSSLVRFRYTFSVGHPFCNFSPIAATVIEVMKTAYFPYVGWPYILLNDMVEILFAINFQLKLCKLIDGFSLI